MALSPQPSPDVASPHLDHLLVEVDDLVRRVVAAPAAAREELAASRLLEAAVATLALDGATAADLPDLERAADIVAGARADAADPADAVERGPGTWLDALGVVDRPSDEVVRALELLGASAALSSDDLAGAVAGPAGLDTLRELHRRSTRGLVDDDRAGTLRDTDQAVHDASVGRIVYLPVPRERIPAELERIGAWLATDARAAHPVVGAGVLHAELLRLHPFDAANGRLARAAARLLLRAGGADPDRLATFEPVLARDPMGYHQAMADTIRRRDLTRFVERWAEAVAAGLRESVRSLGVPAAPVPDRAAAFVGARSDDAFTLADYLEVVDGDREVAVADLRTLLDADRVERVLGSHGLRFVIRDRSRPGTPSRGCAEA